SRQLGLPRLADWDGIPTDVYTLDLHGLDRQWWIKHHAFPLGEKDGQIWIALADVLDIFVPQTIRHKTGKQVVPVIAGSHELRQMIALLESSDVAAGATDESLLQDLATGAPIIKFVNDTIQRAMNAHASDIHFETYRGVFRVRFRVDGVLHEVDRPGLAMQPAIVSRLKLMAGLDISEK